MRIKYDFQQKKSLLLILILCSFSLAAAAAASSSSSSSSHDTYNKLLHCLNNRITTPNSQNNNSNILFTQDNSNYTSVLQSYIRNLRFTYPTTPKPLLIITPWNPPQVSASIICARKLGLHLKIRTGGHDYDGLSYVSNDPFLILDLNNLRNISVDTVAETAYVEAGASLGEFYYRIIKSSNVHGFPAGLCTTLGIGGHFSGGGYGHMIRKYGLTVDHVIDAVVVDYKGRILNRSSMGEDLFWAIRGGGAASFAVVLSYTVKLVPVPETVTVFSVERSAADNVTDVVYKWQSVMKDIDENLFIRLLIQPADKTGNVTVSVTFKAHFLGNAETLVNLLNTELPELGIKKEECRELSWGKALLFWLREDVNGPFEALLNRSSKVDYLKRKSDYVQKPIEKQHLELLWKKKMEVGKSFLVFSSYGGRMNEIAASETPFPHRKGNLYKIQYSINWKEAGKEIDDENVGVLRELYEFMTPYVSQNPRGAFLNYRDIDIGVTGKWSYTEGEVYGRKYFLGNYDRLVKIKSKVDPHNFFRYEQSIPTLGHNKM